MKRFVLTFIVALLATASVSAQAGSFIKNGATLYWKASSGDSGTMRVSGVYGLNFEVDQTNDRNKAAGSQKLYGAVLDGGKNVVLLNVGAWKEVWEGAATADGVTGSISAGTSKFSFEISTNPPVAQAQTAPFLAGKTLKWATNAITGQNGTIKVTGVNGTTFTLDQSNDKNTAAGVTNLDGEVKDGKYYIYNRKWKETWVGTLVDGAVTGTINNSYTFEIWE